MTINNEDIYDAIKEAKSDILYGLGEFNDLKPEIVTRLDVLEEIYWKIQSDVNEILSLWHAEVDKNKEKENVV